MTKSEIIFEQIKEKLEMGNDELIDLFDQFEAIDRFNNNNRMNRIRRDWIFGRTIPELSAKYHTKPEVIKYAIMFHNWYKKPIRGTIAEMFATNKHRLSLCKECYDQWKVANLNVQNA